MHYIIYLDAVGFDRPNGYFVRIIDGIRFMPKKGFWFRRRVGYIRFKRLKAKIVLEVNNKISRSAKLYWNGP